jgi:SAM-dependent methyltransferase
MRLHSDELEQISAHTLAHYDQRAEEFRAGTRSHDVSQNIAALLRHIHGHPPFAILDFGCGPGRDLKAFASLGHCVIGLDGARSFVEMACADTGCEVWHQDFLKLDLPPGRFDGVFANASLFHVPVQELPRVLRQLRDTLRMNGVLFCSNPRGDNEEGWSNGRYGALPRPRGMAFADVRCGLRRTRTLLPPSRSATRSTAVARQCVAQSRTG